MANTTETVNKSNEASNPNSPSHYILMTFGIIIGFTGIILRFVTTWGLVDIASNILLVIGIIISLKAVFNILK